MRRTWDHDYVKPPPVRADVNRFLVMHDDRFVTAFWIYALLCIIWTDCTDLHPMLYNFDIFFWQSKIQLRLYRVIFVLFIGCGPIKSNIAYSILLMVSPDCMIVFSLLVSSMVIASLLLNSRKKKLLRFGKAKKSTWKRDYFGKKSRWCKDQVSLVSLFTFIGIRLLFLYDFTIEVFTHIQVHL